MCINVCASEVLRFSRPSICPVLLCALFHFSTNAIGQPPTPVIDQFTAHSIPLPEGGQLAYYIREGDGPNLVLIPGSWGDYRTFNHLVEHLDRDLKLIIVELRGHNGSQPPSTDCSMELFAEDVLRVIDTIGLKRYYVGGHSIGGMLPIEIAGRRPEQVAGAIAMEGWTHWKVQEEAFGTGPDETITPEQLAERQANRARVYDKLTQEQRDSFSSVWKRWDGYPILETTEVPILEIWGDRGKPKPSRELLRLPDRPNIELVWIEGASHAMQVQRPDAIATAINSFIRQTQEARDSAGQPVTG